MPIEFWFDFASNYSYLSAMRIEALARERGVDIVYRPFLLGPVFKAFGWDNSPFVLQKEKGAWVWVDMERQCRKYGLGWRKPSVFPRRSVLPARLATAAEGQPWQAAFIRAIFELNFVHDQDIENEEALSALLRQHGADPQQMLPAAASDEVRQRVRARTEEAQRRGVFGAPSFFIGAEMFWGNDRLDDALDLAAGANQRVAAP